MPVKELKAPFGYLACAFAQLDLFSVGHCTNGWGWVATRDRLGCRSQFAVDKVTAETDVAGTAGVFGPAGMLLCALVGMVFVMSVLASRLKFQQHC